jgi:hypothetical protein
MFDPAFYNLPSRRRFVGVLLAAFNFAFWAISIEVQTRQWEASASGPLRVEEGPSFWNFFSWVIPAIVSSGLLAAAFFYATKKNERSAKKIVLCVLSLLSYLFLALYLAGCFANVFVL